MGMDDFIALFSGGWNNPMSLDSLSALSGMNKRRVRKMIEDINASGKTMICNLQDGRGYFIPLENELHYARLFQEQEAKRFNSMKNKLHGMNVFLGERNPKKVSDLEKMQMSIFDII